MALRSIYCLLSIRTLSAETWQLSLEITLRYPLLCSSLATSLSLLVCSLPRFSYSFCTSSPYSIFTIASLIPLSYCIFFTPISLPLLYPVFFPPFKKSFAGDTACALRWYKSELKHLFTMRRNKRETALQMSKLMRWVILGVQCYMLSHGRITNPDNCVSAAQFVLGWGNVS